VETEVTSLPPGFNAADAALQRTAPDRVRGWHPPAEVLLECGLARVDDGFHAQGTEQVFVVEAGDGNYVHPGRLRAICNGVGPDVPGSSDDHYRCPRRRLRILEEHLPRRSRPITGADAAFDVTEQNASLARIIPARESELCLAPQNCGLVTRKTRRRPPKSVTPGPTFSTTPEKSDRGERRCG